MTECFEDWLLDQFEVKIIREGKYKGKVCFHTPCVDYTLNPTDWGKIKKKLLEI